MIMMEDSCVSSIACIQYLSMPACSSLVPVNICDDRTVSLPPSCRYFFCKVLIETIVETFLSSYPVTRVVLASKRLTQP